MRKPDAYVANPHDKTLYDARYRQIHRTREAGAWLFGFGITNCSIVKVIAYAHGASAALEQAIAFLADRQAEGNTIFPLTEGKDLSNLLNLPTNSRQFIDAVSEYYESVDGHDLYLDKSELLTMSGPLTVENLREILYYSRSN